jgi:hypothetical protein
MTGKKRKKLKPLTWDDLMNGFFEKVVIDERGHAWKA